jgi:hypothetical protein
VLNVMKIEFEDKYLGLPTPEGRMTRGKLEVGSCCGVISHKAERKY